MKGREQILVERGRLQLVDRRASDVGFCIKSLKSEAHCILTLKILQRLAKLSLDLILDRFLVEFAWPRNRIKLTLPFSGLI